MTESLALETEMQGRNRLDSFYSATSRKSTYFSTGSMSSYHSMDDNEDSAQGVDSLQKFTFTQIVLRLFVTQIVLSTSQLSSDDRFFVQISDTNFCNKRTDTPDFHARPCLQDRSHGIS